jgi:hypothetical protein
MLTAQQQQAASAAGAPLGNATHSQGVDTVQRKNWEPLVLGPALAMDSTPAPVCFSWKFSSGNFSPAV